MDDILNDLDPDDIDGVPALPSDRYVEKILRHAYPDLDRTIYEEDGIYCYDLTIFGRTLSFKGTVATELDTYIASYIFSQVFNLWWIVDYKNANNQKVSLDSELYAWAVMCANDGGSMIIEYNDDCTEMMLSGHDKYWMRFQIPSNYAVILKYLNNTQMSCIKIDKILIDVKVYPIAETYYAIQEFLKIRWFRKSVLSVFPKDVARLIAQTLWAMRYDKCQIQTN